MFCLFIVVIAIYRMLYKLLICPLSTRLKNYSEIFKSVRKSQKLNTEKKHKTDNKNSIENKSEKKKKKDKKVKKDT